MPEGQGRSPVTLWGQGLPIDEVAQASGTVGYELMCALAPRVPTSVATITASDSAAPAVA